MKSSTAWLTILTIIFSKVVLAEEVICHGPKTSICISLGSQSLTYSVGDSDVESHLFDPRDAAVSKEILSRKGGDDDRGGGNDGETGAAANGAEAAEAEEENEDEDEVKGMKVAHGIVMAGVMLVLFPLGALSMRVLGKWYIHAAFQLLSVVVMIIGLGLGIYLAHEEHKLFNNTHTIFGVAIIGLFGTAQPILGFLQHCFFRKNKRRGPAGHVHLWLGRILIVLGVINGGLGLKLSGEDGNGRLAYIIIAVVMGVLYIITVVGFSLRNKASRKAADAKAASDSQVIYPATGPPPPPPITATTEKQQSRIYV